MNEIIKRAVFLDFDGVLFDTVKEAYCVSMIALGRASCISEVDLDSPHFLEFHRNRFLVGPAWNYYYLVPLINEKIDHPSLGVESAFRNAIQNPDSDKHSLFENFFFSARNNCRETDFDNWLSLVMPYAVVNSLRNMMKDHPEKFFLITTRDRGSALQILRAHHLGLLEDSIFGKEDWGISSSKKDIIRRLVGDHRIDEAIFIDDFEGHLLDCDSIESLRSIQARWGYVAPEKKEDNSPHIIQCIENLIQGENVWT